MKWFFKMGMATALAVSMTTNAFAQVQTNASQWAVESMQRAYQLHIVSEDVLLHATDVITRREFTEMAVQFYETVTGEAVNIENIHNPFWDTDQPEIIFAYDKGIISGKTEHIFEPDSPLTREQMAILLVRMLEKSGVTLPQEQEEIVFKDIDQLEEGVKPYIKAIQQAGIMSGFEGEFSPFRNVTIEEAVVAFTAIYEKRVSEEEIVEQTEYESDQSQPADSTATDQQPTDSTAADQQPTDSTAADQQPTDSTAADQQPTDSTAADQQPADSAAADQQPADSAAADQQPADSAATNQQSYEGIVIDGKTISIGESISQLKQDWGEPDRIDQNSYSLERYVYINDYEHFFMVSVKEDKVAEIFTNDMSFQYLDITGKMDYADMKNVKYMDLQNFRVELEDEGNDTYVLLNKDYQAAGILIRSNEYKNGLELRYSTQFLENFETEIMDIINSARVQNGAGVLQSDDKAKNVAYYHSWDMSKNNYVGYTNPEGQNPFDRMTEGGVNYNTAGESVVKIQGGDAIDVYHQWIMEAGTRTNILNPDMTHYGLAAFDSNFTLYVTLDLFTPAQTE